MTKKQTNKAVTPKTSKVQKDSCSLMTFSTDKRRSSSQSGECKKSYIKHEKTGVRTSGTGPKIPIK